MNEKIISVIIPAYNSEDTIKKCVESAICEEVEIIIVDDGSEDKTLEICKEYERKNNNIKVYHQDNRGQAVARKTGIEKANGKYIMFLDSDDSYEQGIFDRIIEVINKNNNPDLIRFRYRKIPNGYDQYKYFQDEEKYVDKKDFERQVYPMFIQGFMLNALWTNCIKREIIKNISLSDEEQKLKFGEDLMVNLKIFSNINNVVFIEDIFYNYIYQENSVTNNKYRDKVLKNIEDVIYINTKLFEYLIDWNMYNKDNIRILSERLKKDIITLSQRL